MDDLRTVAWRFDIEVRSTGGSHHVFSHPCATLSVSIPAHQPLKAIYVKRLLELVDEIKEKG